MATDHQGLTTVPEATASSAGGPQRAEGDTDARQWEYTTYAPAGETCPGCGRPIKSLEICHRALLGRRAPVPTVAYWHADCALGEEGQ
ncbi:hypothetical protein GCM10010394_32060 [Streptomyces crystallinus]|uniref:PARP-type domain-containing protein n=1 Tax=Streptomyces crystallinus TaxID=68191 RepID=A0ABN1FY24_9ACTN